MTITNLHTCSPAGILTRCRRGARFRIVASLWLAGVFGLPVLLAGCSHDARPDPKDTVLRMFEAMRTSDDAALAANIDLESAAQGIRNELTVPMPDSGDTLIDWGAHLLTEMTGDGALRDRWLTDNQIVLGRSHIRGDTALVEVSFLDRVTRVQYYNKMRLVYRHGRWVITHFRTL